MSLWQRAGFTALLVTHDLDEALYMANRDVVLRDRPADGLSVAARRYSQQLHRAREPRGAAAKRRQDRNDTRRRAVRD